MSTVVGIVQDGIAYIGADSLATTDDGYRRNVGPIKKIFFHVPYLIGFIGSQRAAQLVMNHMKTPPPANVFDFPEMLLDLFKEKDCVIFDENQAVMQQCNFLIGTFDGKMYEILCDFQMNEVTQYTAIGSGAHFAFGSLYSTIDEKDAKKRVKTAIKAAAYFDSCTGYPIEVEMIGRKNILEGEKIDLKFEGLGLGKKL